MAIPAENNDTYVLQKKLRRIAQSGGKIPTLNPDGIFGPETMNAVLLFQKLCGLPPTGTADTETRKKIDLDYKEAIRIIPGRGAIYPFPSPGYRTYPDERSETIYFIQLLLSALSPCCDGIRSPAISGIYDKATADNIMRFQRINGMRPTGTVDYDTWNMLAKKYNAYAHSEDYIS